MAASQKYCYAFDIDGNGTIAKVEFFADGNKLGEATTAPYIFVWNSAAPGTTDLKSVSETLTISPYGSGNVGNTVITRTGGSVVINQQNTSLLLENAIMANWTVNYTGSPNDRTTARQTVAILAKGGVAK